MADYLYGGDNFKTFASQLGVPLDGVSGSVLKRAETGYLHQRSLREQALQAELDRQTAQRFGVAPVQSQLPTDTFGAVRLPQAWRGSLKSMSVDPDDFQKWLTERALDQRGGSYQERVRVGQSNLPPREGAPPLEQGKLELFGKVQAALASGADADTKARVARVAFGGPNGQVLAQEFGLWSNQHAQDLDLSAFEHVKRVGGTSLGNLLGGVTNLLGGGAIRTAVGVLTGAKDEQGKPYTGRDISHSLMETLKAPANIVTLGGAGTFIPALAADDRSPGFAQIASTAKRGGVREALYWASPAFRATLATRQSSNRWVRDLGNVLGLGLDVATDPVSYVTLGSGALGKAASVAVGEAAERATILARAAPHTFSPANRQAAAALVRAPQLEWEATLARLGDQVGADTLRAAADAGKAARIAGGNLHHAEGFGAFRDWLARETGANADDLFLRGVAGGKRDIARMQARGGVSLRGGFGPARLGLNLREGRGALQGVKPLSAWFLHPRNGFTTLASRTLDQIAETVHYGAGGGRTLYHENRGLFEATMAFKARGDAAIKAGHELISGTHGKGGLDQVERALKPLRRREPQLDLWLYDMIELGDQSRYKAALEASGRFTPKEKQAVTDAVTELHRLVNEAQEIGNSHGLGIAELREIADDDQIIERYFPHRVKTRIQQEGRFAVAPSTVGAARARRLRAGITLVSPTGEAATLKEGSFREKQELLGRLFGEEAAAQLVSEPVTAARAYILSVTNAAALQHTYKLMSEAGIILPDVGHLVERVGYGGAISGDAVKAAWETPMQQARAARAAHLATQGRVATEVTDLLGARANTLERAAQMRETIAGLARRERNHDTMIEVLGKSVAEKRELADLARADYRQAVQDAEALYARVREVTLRTTGSELRALPEGRDRLRVLLADLKANHEQTLRVLKEDHGRVETALTRTPEQVRRDLASELGRLGAEARSGSRPFNAVRAELVVTRKRLAALEGGELAAAQKDRLLQAALRRGGAARERIVAAQRPAAARAHELGRLIEQAQDAVTTAERAVGGPPKTRALRAQKVEQARAKLAALQTERTEALERASTLGSEAAGLADMLDTAEAAARLADLREGADLASEAGAIFDAARGLSPRLAEPIAKLLRFHAADLEREARHVLSFSPRLKWLNDAMSWDRERLGAYALQVPKGGTPLDNEATRFTQLVGQRGEGSHNAWRAAVGDPERVFQQTMDEYKRQMSTLLARENTLQEQAVRAAQLDPRLQALSAAQREGDTLNLFQSQLDTDLRQLEAWIDNRDEIRKTMALTATALREVTSRDETLRKAAWAAQSLWEQDQATAGEATLKLLSDARIFSLMGPQVEHLAAVVGKLPFMESGVAMPREVGDVLTRLLTQGPSSHRNFLRVLEWFNTKWKRGVLTWPGSAMRRVLGNVYAATALAGVSADSFRTAGHAFDLWRGAKVLSDIDDPKARRYLELAIEHNIFEGQLHAMATEGGRSFETGLARHPIQTAEQIVQQTALRGEDIARFAQFIHGLDSGMGPEAARLWTGKYHFFNHELTARERAIMRPLFPFYAYVRNQTALQVYTLFHNPGKIALYGYASRDLSAPTEGVGEPDWLVQAGGMALPWRLKGGQTFLANTLLDTGVLAAPYNLLGLEQAGAGGGGALGASPIQGDLTGSATPGITGAFALLTGRDLRRGGESLSKQEVNPRLEGILKALGLVDSQGRVDNRAMVTINQLLPMLGGVERITTGGLTQQQNEQWLPYAIGKLLGPNLYTNTERSQKGYLKGQGGLVDQLVPAGERPGPADLTREARIREALARLGAGG